MMGVETLLMIIVAWVAGIAITIIIGYVGNRFFNGCARIEDTFTVGMFAWPLLFLYFISKAIDVLKLIGVGLKFIWSKIMKSLSMWYNPQGIS